MSLSIYLGMKIDTGNKELYEVELYEANITHNLGAMASKAGIYKRLWRPEEIGIETARELIEPLEKGIELLEQNPTKYKKYNPTNGWGDYESLLSFVRSYLSACKKYPKANITVSR